MILAPSWEYGGVFEVLVGNTSLDSTSGWILCKKEEFYSSANKVFSCTKTLVGRFIRVKRKENMYNNYYFQCLCQVVVNGG